jgi:EAL domain-containing protein (putative c-di-GMP-specific phosphodiesterase class I)/CheY-like chemotaxis protein
MMPQCTDDKLKPVMFGHRKMRPRACVVDAKQHLRTFLVEALEEIGFITSQCAGVEELGEIVDRHPPDLIVLGPSQGAGSAAMLATLAARQFAGRILLLGPPDLPAVAAARDLGRQLGLAVLPALATPLDDANLRQGIAALLPADEPPSPPVDVAEALGAGWLALWYQPKFDLRTLSVGSAEALVRMRHPTWGIVPPAYFIPDDADPHFRDLSEFVIRQVIADWHYFVVQHGPIELAINLPVDFLGDPDCLQFLCSQMPDHPAFHGLVVEVNGTELLRNLTLMREVAGKVRFYNIAISIDDLGAEWASFTDTAYFPFVEIKVDRKFVAGCAEDRLKQVICRRILDLADGVGARTVAEGVETWPDFLCVRDMGFDVVQGFLFAKPMPARKFARAVLGRPATLMH